MTTEPETSKPLHFIHKAVEEDNRTGRFDGRCITRFPPEPNGYLHIGHAKSICLNFGTAIAYGGICSLRFDDTNPEKESQEYVDAIQEDVRWLGYDWGEHLHFASDYFEQMYAHAVRLIEQGKAYVCDLSADDFAQYRGVPSEPGSNCPSRTRAIKESLDIFGRMRAGEFKDSEFVLRALIDMASPNIHMRDPVIFRVKKGQPHHRTGTDWCIFPMYDFAHCLGDSIEGVTHSLCTTEFEVHREIYDWYLDALDVYHPQQIEFTRLNLSYTVLSKRLLHELVDGGHVSGWDDPRMPTLSGIRRLGIPPAVIIEFCDRVGVTKYDGLTDLALFEHCVRDNLNRTSERRLAVIRPLRVVIENYPEDEEETFTAINNPEDPEAGTRQIPFCRELIIDRDDFMEEPRAKFFRLAVGREVRLRAACYITCTDVVRDDATGTVTELRCTWDPESRGASTPDGRKVKGTIHWLSARHAVAAEFRLYDRLFTCENPMDTGDGGHFLDHINSNSLEVVKGFVEPSVAGAAAGSRWQFERLGYFCVESAATESDCPVFNRTIPLRDSWSKK